MSLTAGSVCAQTQVASLSPAAVTPAPAAAAPRKKLAVKRRAARTSAATLAGLRETPDPLELSSSVAFMMDQDSGEVFFEKNADEKLPIASVTKLMTALVIAESGLPMHEVLRVSYADYVKSKADSLLKVGMALTREAALKAALMSSDNRAAHMLARTYPGGVKAFVAAMNEKAQELEMTSSVFDDPTGLSNRNLSTAHDLGRLAVAAHEYDVIRRASTAAVATLNAGGERRLHLQTTNRLIGDPRWKVGLQKTGYTTAAGRCMVVQSEFADRRVVLVVLDSDSSGQRAGDMQRMKSWLEEKVAFEKGFARLAPYGLL